jgi:hypothetical protein
MSDKKSKPRHRDAESGKMVSKEYADANPATTISETKPVLTLTDASALIRGIIKHYKVVTDGIEAGDGRRFVVTGSVADVEKNRILLTFDDE